MDCCSWALSMALCFEDLAPGSRSPKQFWMLGQNKEIPRLTLVNFKTLLKTLQSNAQNQDLFKTLRTLCRPLKSFASIPIRQNRHALSPHCWQKNLHVQIPSVLWSHLQMWIMTGCADTDLHCSAEVLMASVFTEFLPDRFAFETKPSSWWLEKTPKIVDKAWENQMHKAACQFVSTGNKLTVVRQA